MLARYCLECGSEHILKDGNVIYCYECDSEATISTQKHHYHQELLESDYESLLLSQCDTMIDNMNTLNNMITHSFDVIAEIEGSDQIDAPMTMTGPGKIKPSK